MEHSTQKHIAYDDLDWVDLGGSGWKRAAVTIDKGESAWNPASTKHVIWGPATVTYQEAPDGGIDAIVDDA